MRTYNDIYKSYLEFMKKITDNKNFEYKTFMEADDEKTQKALCYRHILELCHDEDKGFFYFLKFIIGDLKDLGFPKPLRYNQLFRKWDLLIRKHKHLAILCSRGHGKSLFFSQLYQLYDMFINPSRKILIESASQEQADILLEEIRRVVDNNEWLLTKKSPDKWRTSVLGYNGGFILGKGFGSEVRGLHLDRIVIDDILRSDNKLTHQQIEDFVDLVLEPMLLNRNGQMIIVGTPMNEKDIFTTVKKRAEKGGVWKVYEFPAIIDYDKKIIQCPDRFTFEMLMAKKATMGSLKFDREYQLKLFSRDQSLFPQAMINISKDKGKPYYLLSSYNDSLKDYSIIAGVDVARSGSVSADYTVMVVMAYNSNTQEKRIIGFWREKGLKISVQAERIANISKNFNNCVVIVEKNNIGQDMIDALADDHNVFVEDFTTTHKSKDDLIRFLINSFEHEQIIMPQADENSRENMKILEDELIRFGVTITPAGNEVYGALTGHDDACLPPDQLIQTLDGVKKIQDITESDVVLTHKGNYKKVTTTFKRFYKGNIVDIKRKCGNRFSVTENHPVYIIDSSGFGYFKPAKHITREDYLGFTVPEYEEKLEYIDMANYKSDRYIVHNDFLIESRSKYKIKRFVKNDSDLRFLIGMFLAEGHARSNRGFVSFTIHNKEIDIKNMIIDKMKLVFGIESTISHYKNKKAISICFNSKPINNFFKQFGMKENKKLSRDFLHLPKDEMVDILVGYLYGDGSVSNKTGTISASSISIELIIQMRMILSKFGLHSSFDSMIPKTFKWGDRYYTRKSQYRLAIYKTQSNKLYNIIPKKYRHVKFIEKRVESKSDNVKHFERVECSKPYSYLDTQYYEGYVYNFEVEDDNSYVVVDTAVHNCMALAICNKGTQIYGTPFAVSDFGKDFSNNIYKSPYQYLQTSSKETDLFNKFSR